MDGAKYYMTIRAKILLVFLSLTLLPLATLSLVASLCAQRALEQEVLEHLHSVAAFQKHRGGKPRGSSAAGGRRPSRRR